MRIQAIATAAAMAFFAVVTSAISHPLLVGNTTAATGLDNVVIDGQTYDVTFSYGLYGDVFGSKTPTFYGDFTETFDAGYAVVDALNILGVTSIAGGNPDHFFIPDGMPYSGVSQVVSGSRNAGQWDLYGAGFAPQQYEAPWTSFSTASAAPEPSVWVILVGGLAMAGATFRHRRTMMAARHQG